MRLLLPAWRAAPSPSGAVAAGAAAASRSAPRAAITRLTPWLVGTGLVAAAVGLVAALLLAAPPAEPGDLWRIAYVHLPAAWLSWVLYVALAASALAARLRSEPLWAALSAACAPTGALMAFLALWTGSLWGKPLWGVWWTWEPRFATQLLLLFLFLGVLALQAAQDDVGKASRAAGVLALVGAGPLPLLYASVAWWGRHAGSPAVVLPVELPLGGAVLATLVAMVIALGAWALAAVLHRTATSLLEQEARVAGQDAAPSPERAR